MGMSAYRRVLGTAGNVSYSDGARRKAGEGLLRNSGAGGGKMYRGVGVRAGCKAGTLRVLLAFKGNPVEDW